VFFAGQSLESATADSARLIMTGQAQTYDKSKFPTEENAFKNSVCSRIFALFNCQAGIIIDVRTYSDFASISSNIPLDSQGNLKTSDFAYQPSTKAGDIVVVRIMYQWPVYVSLLGLNLADLSGNKRLLVATAAFRNEPF